ncbi:MAG: flagellar basal body-associated FliL family protein [Rhodothermales bacterium]
MPENSEIPEEELLDDVEDVEESEGGGIFHLLKFLIPIVLFTLGGGGYLAYTQYANLAEAAVSIGVEFGFAGKAEGEGPIEYGEFMTIDDLLINPAGSSGKRFLVVSLGVESKDSGVLAELAEKDIVVRDAILGLFSERTADELASIDLRGQLKKEIIAELNTILQKGEIDRLYFTQFLLQ